MKEPFERKDGSLTPAYGIVITNLIMFALLLWLEHPTLSGLPLGVATIFLIVQCHKPAKGGDA